jgi:DNA/RNA endonuclease YhcR with UshA esterase domain
LQTQIQKSDETINFINTFKNKIVEGQVITIQGISNITHNQKIMINPIPQNGNILSQI